MAGARDVVLRYLSTFDASGAEAAAKGNEGVARSVDVLGKSKQKLGKDLVDLEVKQRRVEGATRAIASQFLMAGQAGFSFQTAANAGASAISFLGNTMKFASGPIGILATIGTTLAATFLATSIGAKETKTTLDEVVSKAEVYGTALSLLAASGKEENSAAAERLKTMQSLATAEDAVTKLAEGGTKARAAETEASGKLAAAEFQVARAKYEVARARQDDKNFGTQTAIAKEEDLRRAEAELGKIASSYTKAKEATEPYTEATKALSDANKKEAAISARLDDLLESLTGKRGKAAAAVLALQSAEQVRADTLVGIIGGEGELLDELDAEHEADFQRKMQRISTETAAERALFNSKVALAQAWGGVAGNLANYLEQTNKASFEQIKSIRYAETVVNTAAAVMMALHATPFYPVNVGLAIAAGASGAIQLATIASASPGGGGSIATPSLGGGGGAAGGGGGGTVLTAPGAGGGGGGGGTITVNLSIEALQLYALDFGSLSVGEKRRFARELVDLIAFELNGLGNQLGR